MLQYAFFTITSSNAASESEALNRFLRSRKTLTVKKEFALSAEGGVWHICVEYFDGIEPSATTSKGGSRNRPKVDYREVLSPEAFALFARLRETRKAIAEKEAIPVYAVFSNEQLATMAREKPETLADLQKIDGVGEARIEKYGQRILDTFNHETSGHPVSEDS